MKLDLTKFSTQELEEMKSSITKEMLSMTLIDEEKIIQMAEIISILAARESDGDK